MITPNSKKVKVKLGKAVIETEIANSLFKKTRGLMFRKSLVKNGGMLFVFDRKARHAIWTFGMRFPIDIIWIDDNKRIVDISKKATPCWLFCKIFIPKKKAKYVLEVNAGFVEKNRIKIGDKLRFQSK